MIRVGAHQEGKLVCILAGRRHPHSSRPVVVEVGELVGESLDVLGQQPGGVLHHVVGGGVHSALVHRLRHKEEVVPAQDAFKSAKVWTRQTSQAESRHCRPQFHLEGWKASHSSCIMAMQIVLECYKTKPKPYLKNLVLILLLTIM